HDVHTVIEDADNHFQTLDIAAQREARGSAGVMWQAMQNQEHYIDKRLPELQQTLKSEISPADQQKLGINFDKPLTPDQIQNAIIKHGLDSDPKKPMDPVSQHLTEYLTLNEMNNLYSTVKTAADVANKAPAMVNLAYADFLMKYKNGVTEKQGPDGKTYATTAADIVKAISAADKAALPGSQITQEQAEKMTVDLMRSHGISDDKNPLIPLLDGQKKNDIGLLQKAADLSKDDKFDKDKTAPEWNANQKAIAELKASVKDREPTADEQKKYQQLLDDNAVLQARMFVRSDAYKALGEAELKQKDPDLNKAMGDLRTSIQSDPRNTPKGSEGYKAETDPDIRWANYQKQAQAIKDGKLLGDHPELKDALKMAEENPEFKKNFVGAFADAQKFQEMLKQHPPGAKPPTDEEMKEMRKTLDSWNANGDAVQKALGNSIPAIDKAYQDMSAKKDLSPQEKQEFETVKQLYFGAHQKTFAEMEQGRFDARTGHIDDAKAKMEDAGKDAALLQNPAVKEQLDAYNGIVKQAQFDNSPWYARWGK